MRLLSVLALLIVSTPADAHRLDDWGAGAKSVTLDDIVEVPLQLGPCGDLRPHVTVTVGEGNIGNGGDISLTAGKATATSVAGGSVYITAGQGSNVGADDGATGQPQHGQLVGVAEVEGDVVRVGPRVEARLAVLAVLEDHRLGRDAERPPQQLA